MQARQSTMALNSY